MEDLEISFDRSIADDALETASWDAAASRELSHSRDKRSPVTEVRISLSPRDRPGLALGMTDAEFADINAVYNRLQKAKSCGFGDVRTLISPVDLNISWHARMPMCYGDIDTLPGIEPRIEASLRLLANGLVNIYETIEAGDEESIKKLASADPASRSLLEITRICASRHLRALIMRADDTWEEIQIPDVQTIPPPAPESSPGPKPITAVFSGFTGNHMFLNRGSIRVCVPESEIAMLKDLQAGDLVQVVQRRKQYRCIKALEEVKASDIRVIHRLFRLTRPDEELQLRTPL